MYERSEDMFFTPLREAQRCEYDVGMSREVVDQRSFAERLAS